MLSKNKLVEGKLKNIVLLNEADENDWNYDWINDQEDINFWDFLSMSFLKLERLFILLDVESSPNSGWEKFIETLGLTRWEDRRWCTQYHNGAGPSRTALVRLIESKVHDEKLSLSSVLLLLKEMDRFDILLQIDWKELIERFRKLQSASYAPGSCLAVPLAFQLNQQCLTSELVSSECIDDAHDHTAISASEENAKVKKSFYKKCILMSYASDAKEFAHKVAKQLRESSIKKHRFKIVMLGDPEIKQKLSVDCNNTLHKWFLQVRYVVPVLSPQYLKQVQNLDVGEDRDLALYNRFIYRFTLDQYVNDGSNNLRCRPICPKQFIDEVREKAVVKGNGLFFIIWGCNNEEQIEEFRDVLLEAPL